VGVGPGVGDLVWVGVGSQLGVGSDVALKWGAKLEFCLIKFESIKQD